MGSFTGEKVALSVKTPVLNTTTPCVTPSRSCDPNIQTLQPQMKVLLWSQVSDLGQLSAPASPQESPGRLLNNVSNASQHWGRCVKTAHRSACQRLCETRARCPMHKVPRLLFRGSHISDVFLFLRREERGRGVSVPRDGRGAFLERDTQQKIPGGICLSEFTPKDCATLVGRTRCLATLESTQYVTMCPWAQTCKSAPPNSSCSKIPRLKGSCLPADPLLECFSIPANYIFLIL